MNTSDVILAWFAWNILAPIAFAILVCVILLVVTLVSAIVTGLLSSKKNKKQKNLDHREEYK